MEQDIVKSLKPKIKRAAGTFNNLKNKINIHDINNI